MPSNAQIEERTKHWHTFGQEVAGIEAETVDS
jgi:hypothetical protein